MIEATTVRTSDAYLLPGKATPTFGYGYLLWLLPGKRRQFALVGALGQRICIDPASKLVMVQTALDDKGEVWRLWSAWSSNSASVNPGKELFARTDTVRFDHSHRNSALL